MGAAVPATQAEKASLHRRRLASPRRARSEFASPPAADVASRGFDVHEFWAPAAGERADWLRFGAALGSALAHPGLPHSLAVHPTVRVLE